MTEMDLVIREFLVESRENLDQLDRDLIAIEKNPGGRESLDSIFRTFHTIKGTCGFFDFPRLEAVTHAAESLLSDLREGRSSWGTTTTGILLDVVDVVRQHLESIERSGFELLEDHSQLIATLDEVRSVGSGPIDTPPSGRGSIPIPAPDSVPSEVSPPRQRPAAELSDEFAGGGPGEGTLRVDVSLLDVLMNLVGELVLTRNQINAAGTPPSIQGAAQRLNLITSELQEGVLRTRMQSIGTLWNRFPRIIRDLAIHCRKEVRIEMVGKATGLDKTILEAIKDPLTHLIRNAVDHGIEPPEARLAAGKAAEGTVHLHAYHEGGMVNIEIRDDGAGISPSRIRQKAVERGLITAEQAARLDDREALRLIFTPGFSTADAVTSVSGRGVGMDVVKTNVEKIGGNVDLRSEVGVGTSFQIKIPLTLAIIPALIVTSGGDRFAIPQVSLLELVRLEGEECHRKIERVEGVALYRLRGHLLPLIELDRLLGVATGDVPPSGADHVVNIVVLQADNAQFGLIVPEINDTQEIVVKPLARQLKKLAIFSGTTIMGDGRVSLILDVLGIARASGMGARHAEDEPARKDSANRSESPFLLVGLCDGSRLALPLGSVTRLEEIPAEAVETAIGREVIQYRGNILPLVRISERFAGASSARDRLHVVIATDAGRDVGLVVEEIIDIVSESTEVQELGKGPGILGTAVLQRRVTGLIDVAALIRESTATRRGA